MGQRCSLELSALGAPLSALESDDLLHYRVGNVHIRPQFSAGMTYNDNIFFRSDDALRQLLVGPKEGDLINQIGPGVQLSPSEKIRSIPLLFSYNYLHRFYTDHSEVSSGDHIASLSGAITSGKIRASTQPFIELRDRDSRWKYSYYRAK
jgi:hypothetical protein